MPFDPSSRKLWLLPLALVMLCSQAAPGGQSEPSAKPEVIVTGERLTPAQRRDRVVAYVRYTGIAAGERPTARWIDLICLKVVGLPDASALAVTARVQEIALAAGARLDRPGCRTNALIAFTADGAATVREISSKRSASLQEVAPADRKVLMTSSDPVRWWYSTQARSRDDTGPTGSQSSIIAGESNKDASGTGSAASGGQTLPGNMDTSFQSVRGMSLISTESVRAIHASNVIIDAKQLRGVGLDSVTDYAAFVTLAEVRPRLTGQPDSILGVFADTAASQRRLTEWDALMLKALYHIKLDRAASLQRGALTAALDNAVKRPD